MGTEILSQISEDTGLNNWTVSSNYDYVKIITFCNMNKISYHIKKVLLLKKLSNHSNI